MVDRDAVRRGYDSLGESYATSRAAGDDLELLEWVLDRLTPTATLLDAGCGPGRPLLRRASEAVRAVGLDLSRTQLKLAAANAPGAGLVQGDLATLPLDGGSVDAVTAFHSLIHVPLADHPDVIGEFARVLRRGGSLLVTEGHGEWCGENPDWLDSGVAMQWEIAGADATRDQLKATGFTVDREWTVGDDLGDGGWRVFGAELGA